MAATIEERSERITSEAQDEYAKFEKKMQAGGAHAQPPSSGSSDGGKEKDDKSGSSGGGGGKEGGSSPANSGGKMSPERKLKMVYIAVLMLGALFVAISMTVYSLRSTTAEGEKHMEVLRSYQDKQEARDHEKAMKELAIKEARMTGRSSQKNQTPVLGCVNPTEMTSYWSAPVKIGASQCVKVSSGTMREFWITLASKPNKVVGKASFAEAKRPLSIEEKLEGKKKCIAGGTDEATCDLDAQKPRGIWVDDCVTKQTTDSCLGYLQSKNLGTSIHVYATDVEIQTN